MRRNHMSLPDEGSCDSSEVLQLDSAMDTEDSRVSVEVTSSQAASCEIFDRLVFLAVPLAVVVEEGSETPMTTKSSAKVSSYSAFDGSVKSPLLLETGLQCMVR